MTSKVNNKIYKNLIELIGNTPLVEIKKIDTGLCHLFVKMECLLPGGSLKDRSALFMIKGAEDAGLIKPGDTLVEATSGNTALGLALVAAIRGYKLLIVVTNKVSQEKVNQIKATGAEVVVTRCDLTSDHPDYYHNLAKRLASERKAFYVNQFGNENNPLAHEITTAPEIWRDMQHNLDAVVCGIGTGGHMSGISHYFQKNAPHVKMIIADPQGSVIAPYIKTGKIEPKGCLLVEGIGEDCIRPLCDFSLVHDAITIPDREAFATAHELLRKEGIFAGSSTGVAVAAALRYCRAQQKEQRVVTFVYDSGSKYLSKMYNNEWLREHQLLVADLVSSLV
jgi:cystathionine beta-synthase